VIDIKNKYLKYGCIFAVGSNLILFFTKLYIGLGANSISIYSDGINNFFDSLSAVVTLVCLSFLWRNTDKSSRGYISKAEDLLTFIISAIIGFTGFYFAYSSVERLMYPTTVSYRTKYLYILIATAIAKLIMYAVLKALNKKGRSDILKLMSLDCILDFFITGVTVMTLLISTYGNYAADALCGMVISVIITVSAVKSLLSACRKLIGYLPAEKRESFLESLSEIIDENDIETVRFHLTDSESEAFIYTAGYKKINEDDLEKLSKQTGITVYIIPGKENTEISV
jgi:cation diffusion facilitator family transporter